jgi:hypothetical protein
MVGDASKGPGRRSLFKPSQSGWIAQTLSRRGSGGALLASYLTRFASLQQRADLVMSDGGVHNGNWR